MARSVINWPPRPGSVDLDYGTANSEEIYFLKTSVADPDSLNTDMDSGFDDQK
jgi:hypothetical protein